MQVRHRRAVGHRPRVESSKPWWVRRYGRGSSLVGALLVLAAGVILALNHDNWWPGWALAAAATVMVGVSLYAMKGRRTP